MVSDESMFAEGFYFIFCFEFNVEFYSRDATNEYFVLEVNANCGIGYDSSSAQILKLGGKGIAYLVDRVISIGGNDPSKKNQGKSIV